ncbi:sensor histidine kinase [Bacillus sp. FJAT-49754]|uniref:histidine kinase n=2 Tax=Lederbergia citrea TaxID=2833581 RepID=A0A942UM98_9BACI|nr:sensor histidine kinase [Lederbergia citrea]MBS4221268.1 sensor histidine kinase [Lederbergia citrea]
MEYVTIHFLFNLTLLIILLFLCLILPKRFSRIRLYKKTALLYLVISLILCYLFSYSLSDELVLDLRIVPFLIGGLYMRLSPILGLCVIIMRGFHGFDLGFFIVVAFYGLFSFLIWWISPWFLKLTSIKRIIFLISITLFVSLGILMMMEIVGHPHRTLDVWFAYIVIPPLGVAMISYIIEMMDKNVLLQQQLVKAEKLEALEQMGAAISHEIRNPLTTAIGFVQFLEEGLYESEKRDQYLSIIKGELDSAERVIKDYLTFSKPVIESVEQLDINQELAYLLNILQPLTKLNSIKVSTNFSSKGHIKGDRQKFHQCFINIIRYAIESMPNGGNLLIETYSIQTDMIIKIQDTGKGMSKVQLKRLGEPYYSTKGAKGTGLGIMVAYSIVWAMNGTIDVHSEIGKGTTFQFSFKLYSSNLHR